MTKPIPPSGNTYAKYKKEKKPAHASENNVVTGVLDKAEQPKPEEKKKDEAE